MHHGKRAGRLGGVLSIRLDGLHRGLVPLHDLIGRGLSEGNAQETRNRSKGRDGVTEVSSVSFHDRSSLCHKSCTAITDSWHPSRGRRGRWPSIRSIL